MRPLLPLNSETQKSRSLFLRRNKILHMHAPPLHPSVRCPNVSAFFSCTRALRQAGVRPTGGGPPVLPPPTLDRGSQRSGKPPDHGPGRAWGWHGSGRSLQPVFRKAKAAEALPFRVPWGLPSRDVSGSLNSNGVVLLSFPVERWPNAASDSQSSTERSCFFFILLVLEKTHKTQSRTNSETQHMFSLGFHTLPLSSSTSPPRGQSG